MQAYRARPFLIDQLIRPVKTGRIVHARIFSGPAGTGKKTAAEWSARAINCEATGERPCNVCPSCLRFLSGNAPELIRLSPDAESSFIKVDAIRALIDVLSVKPDRGYKCVIISPADRMNDAAQNALLKTLEEAPPYAVFFLITESLSRLLPTIRSRCAVMRFAPLSTDEVYTYLIGEGINESEAREAAAFSGGCIGKALDRINNPAYKDTGALLTACFQKYSCIADAAAISAEIGKLKDKSRIVLSILEASAHELMNGGELSALSKALSKNGIDGARLMRAVINCAQSLEHFVTFQYAIDMLLYEIIPTEES